MIGAYLSPVAPAAVLLLSAFILSIVVPRLPPRWLAYPGLAYLIGPGLVAVAILTLFGIRLTFGQDSTGVAPELLSGWDFSDPETAAGLTVRADELSLPFLTLALILLLVLALWASPYRINAGQQRADSEVLDKSLNLGRLSNWFVLGAGTCFLFVAANLLTLGYAVLAFDILLVIFWLNRRHSYLAVGRLFLGILTAGAFALAEVAPDTGLISGLLLLGIALWLRLGVYPFFEVTDQPGWPDKQRLMYLGFSLAVGLYLVIRVLGQPLPELVGWLVTVTLAINGLLAWLADRRSVVVTHVILAEVLLLLLPAPLPTWVMIAYSLGLILSLIALGVTPPLGRPNPAEGAWFWPYFSALLASLTLLGIPLSLGWLPRIVIYESLLLSKSMLMILLVIMADALALSGLVRYWAITWQGARLNGWRSALGIVVAVPFLIPYLGPYVLSTITRLEPQPGDYLERAGFWVVLLAVVAAALGLGYFREPLIKRSRSSPAMLTRILHLRWLLSRLGRWLSRAGKLILRINIVIEGRHYIGWAVFAVIVGTLLILLRTQP